MNRSICRERKKGESHGRNYACAKCGRTFGRKSSAVRHARTIEKGAQTILPYPSYAAGLARGLHIPPLPRPQYGKSMQETLADTYLVELAKKVAEKAISDPATEKTVKSMIFNGFMRIQKREAKNDESADKLFNSLSSYFGHH